ncbi:adenylate kinase [Methylorubrum populi]|uniref:Adenylate kinase n=1 Tax=Methylorubrum populi TaxID=223967 RepID=A0A833JBQ2_9HYPH|nr:adenylate kinase [Methylorubrum populi]
MRDFIAELCLVDGGVLIGWIRGERHGNIADVVASSAELYFKESVLTYADAADVCLDWGRSMQVVLDLEFSAEPMTVFFKLVLDEVFAGVAIQRIVAEETGALSLEGFAHALSQARVGHA